MLYPLHGDWHQFDIQFRGHGPQMSEAYAVKWRIGIPKEADSPRRRNGLLKQLKSLGHQLGCNVGQTGDVSAWVSKALHEARPHGISNQRHDDRDRLRCAFGC